jgi:hypothetical protein
MCHSIHNRHEKGTSQVRELTGGKPCRGGRAFSLMDGQAAGAVAPCGIFVEVHHRLGRAPLAAGT